ncbi:MAG TPA: hypothetical protein VHF25_03250 [Nitriliruptorales bacterium]|nr:hypothetical protein [Nitriliruptorales bacterium]
MKVDIWRGWLDTLSVESADDAEHRRANKLADPLTQRRFLAGRGSLRLVLGHMLGVPACDVPLRYLPSGRPLLLDGPSFSVTHAGGLMLVAVAPAGEIGVDIEHLRPVPGADRLSRRVLGRPLGGRDFLQAWVAHEAAVKARGGRLLDSLVPAPPASHRILRLRPSSGYVGALALTPFNGRVRVSYRPIQP